VGEGGEKNEKCRGSGQPGACGLSENWAARGYEKKNSEHGRVTDRHKKLKNGIQVRRVFQRRMGKGVASTDLRGGDPNSRRREKAIWSGAKNTKGVIILPARPLKKPPGKGAHAAIMGLADGAIKTKKKGKTRNLRGKRRPVKKGRTGRPRSLLGKLEPGCCAGWVV